MRRVVLVGTVIGAALAAAALAAGPADPNKAREVFQSLYGQELESVAKSWGQEDDLALAQKMVDAARRAQAEPEFLILLCTKAYDLSSNKKGGYGTAEEAMKLLARRIPERAEECREKTLEARQREFDWFHAPDRKAAGERLIDLLLEVAQDRLKAGTDVGNACWRANLTAAIINSDRKAEVQQKTDDLKAAHQAEQQFTRLRNQLDARPADAKAREDLILLYVVQRDDPMTAAKYVTAACSPMVQTCVPAAAKPVADVPADTCLLLGDWYRDLGEKASGPPKAVMLTHAEQYYDRFLAEHKAADLDRTRAEIGLRRAKDHIDALSGVSLAPGSAFREGKWVDILVLTDPVKHRSKGDWKRVGTALAIEPIDGGRLMLPVVPEGSYELQVTFVRTKGTESVGVILPLGGGTALLRLSRDGAASGLELLDGKRAHENETTVKPGTIENNRGNTIDARVIREKDRVRIAIALNGKQIIQWQGRPKQFELLRGMELPNQNAPGLFAYNCAVDFRSARLRMISGEAKLLK
jgi:hypothetical protein